MAEFQPDPIDDDALEMASNAIDELAPDWSTAEALGARAEKLADLLRREGHDLYRVDGDHIRLADDLLEHAATTPVTTAAASQLTWPSR